MLLSCTPNTEWAVTRTKHNPSPFDAAWDYISGIPRSSIQVTNLNRDLGLTVIAAMLTQLQSPTLTASLTPHN